MNPLTIDDLIDAFFSAAEHENHVDVLRDYHNLKRDILIELYSCSLPPRVTSQSRSSAERNRELDHDAIVSTANMCLKQATALGSPFGYYLEGRPGPLESHLRRVHKTKFDAALNRLRKEYRDTFKTAIELLHPEAADLVFPRSSIYERGLPKEEPSDPFDFW